MRIKVIQDVIDILRRKKCKCENLFDTYYVEIFSDCNLKCSLCGLGSRDIFQRAHGKMTLEKFKKILDKIKKDSPTATVAPFHHCEPMLHPELPKMIKYIKEKKLKSFVSFNFNYVNNLDDILKAGIDTMVISVSGFYQETYQKAHIGGDIEKVKANLILLRERMDALKVSPDVHVVYHMYRDNIGINGNECGGDYIKMKEFVKNLNFNFSPLWARCISLELSLKYIREKGLSQYKGETLKWFDELAPLNEVYLKTVEERMLHVPEDYLSGTWLERKLNSCPVNGRILNIHWTGEMSLCSWAVDDRCVAGDYLTSSAEQLYEIRKNHPLCKECLANNYVLYTEYGDKDEINRIAEKKLGYKLPNDMKM